MDSVRRVVRGIARWSADAPREGEREQSKVANQRHHVHVGWNGDQRSCRCLDSLDWTTGRSGWVPRLGSDRGDLRSTIGDSERTRMGSDSFTPTQKANRGCLGQAIWFWKYSGGNSVGP